MEDVWRAHCNVFIIVAMHLALDKVSSLGCGSYMDYLVSGQMAIPDESISASSVHQNDVNLHDPKYARLLYHNATYHSAHGAWTALDANQKQYIEVAFGCTRIVCAVFTQGRQNSDQWVTSYNVAYSFDDINWVIVSNSENKQMFQGNTDPTTVVRNNFHRCVEAKFMRINPQTWMNYISMRMDFQGCSKRRSDFLFMKKSRKIRFWKKDRYATHTLKQISKVTSMHVGSCAISCYKMPLCMHYMYQANDRTCTLFSKTDVTQGEVVPEAIPLFVTNIEYFANSYEYRAKNFPDGKVLYYRITAEKKTKTDASKTCNTDDGRLLVIDNQDIMAFIQQEIQKNLILIPEIQAGYFVNGGYNGTSWVFDTQQEIPLFLWAPSHPLTNSKDCVVIAPSGLQSKECTSGLYYVCELVP